MALTHLLDTSVLTRLRKLEIRTVIEPKAQLAQLARAGISDLEIGYSARNDSEWDRLADALGVFELIETTAEHVVRARHVQRLLASKHQRGRKVPDLLIAAAAEASGLILLHYDSDFDQIAAVTRQTCEWVVPARSVD
jgi:predicted nucleic acid-binding protein